MHTNYRRSILHPLTSQLQNRSLPLTYYLKILERKEKKRKTIKDTLFLSRKTNYLKVSKKTLSLIQNRETSSKSTPKVLFWIEELCLLNNLLPSTRRLSSLFDAGVERKKRDGRISALSPSGDKPISRTLSQNFPSLPLYHHEWNGRAASSKITRYAPVIKGDSDLNSGCAS